MDTKVQVFILGRTLFVYFIVCLHIPAEETTSDAKANFHKDTTIQGEEEKIVRKKIKEENKDKRNKLEK